MIKKILLLIFTFSFFNFTFAQKAHINYGQNFTKYDYKNSNGDPNPNLRTASGTSFEFGYEFPLKNYRKLKYDVSITLNQYNAKGGDVNNIYSWETSYLGIDNDLNYCIYQQGDNFQIIANIGFGFTSIIKGEQAINTILYNITKEKEFSGLFIKPFTGIDIRYQLSDNMQIKVGYSISRVMHLSNKIEEKLAFNNNQIQFGLYFPLK